MKEKIPMLDEKAAPSAKAKTGRTIDKLGFGILLASLVLLQVCHVLIFTVVPTEAVMGAVQRIFYFHVGMAIAAYLAFGIVLVASLGALGTKEHFWDELNAAAGEIAFLLCTGTLLSGMIWARTAWNIWFRWEPRLVTFLLLWCLSCSLLFIRAFAAERARRAQCAVVGIMGAMVVPLVWLSVHLLPQVAQLHPTVVEKGGLKDVRYVLCFILSVLAWSLFSIGLIWLRLRLQRVQRMVSSSRTFQ